MHYSRPEDDFKSQLVRNQVIDEEKQKRKPIQNSSNVSSTIFGYNLNY
jgi:hypothetical protein